MDLTARGPNGRLDSMAACMLLWSGSVRFEQAHVAWDGTRHSFQSPTIADDVISLYGMAREEVTAVLPDLLDLLDALECDEQLRVSAEAVADAVREVLPEGDLSGATLFLLQSGGHPLVVESKDQLTVRVRYDDRLVRGIPHLQRLLCRMLAQLRVFRGSGGPFTVLFVKNDARRTCGIRDFEGDVHDADAQLDARVEVSELPVPDTTGAAARSPELDFLRIVGSLEGSVYTTDALRGATTERIRELEEEYAKLENAKPDPGVAHDKGPRPASLGLPTGGKAARSLALRSALYLIVGIVLMLLGRLCIVDGQAVSLRLMGVANGAMDTAMGFAHIVLGQAGVAVDAGTTAVPTLFGLSADALVGPLRVVGFVLVTLGIVFPVRKIVRHKRRLDHELAHTQSHLSFIEALTEKRRLANEMTYAQTLDKWALNLKHTLEDTEQEKASLAQLDATREELSRALEGCYAGSTLVPQGMRNLVAVCTLADYLDTGRASELEGADGAIAQYQSDLAALRIDLAPEQATALQPTLRTTVRSTAALLRRMETAAAEEQRQQIVREHCQKAASLVAGLR